MGEKNLPAAPESLVPRLGQFLLERRLIEPAELEHALAVQSELTGKGEQVLLGQLMVRLGIIDQRSLDQVVTEQIVQLQNALERSNHELTKRVEQRTVELQSALARLSELNQLKASFVSNVSHELRMPLQFLMGYLDLLATKTLGPLTNDQAKAVDSLVNASHRLKDLVGEMLEFSQLTSSNVPLDISPLSLETPVQAAVQQTQPKAKSRNIAINARFMSGLPLVQADGKRITWVLEQLLDNAVKFTPEGGQVAVEATAQDKTVRVAVEDNGIGIPQERLHEIFVPFHQLDGSTTRHHGGIGLGLALAQSIMEAHGTSITVHSRVGRGSCFAFSLPSSR